MTSLAGMGEELAGAVAAVGATGAAGEERLARDDATETMDGSEVGGTTPVTKERPQSRSHWTRDRWISHCTMRPSPAELRS